MTGDQNDLALLLASERCVAGRVTYRVSTGAAMPLEGSGSRDDDRYGRLAGSVA